MVRPIQILLYLLLTFMQKFIILTKDFQLVLQLKLLSLIQTEVSFKFVFLFSSTYLQAHINSWQAKANIFAVITVGSINFHLSTVYHNKSN